MVFLLQYDTKYYYVVGVGQTERMFWFFSPPEIGPDVPYTFGLIGIVLKHSVMVLTLNKNAFY